MKKLSLLFLAALISLPMTAQISVTSYNIRYANETDGENSWSKRKDYLASQIAFYEPGILGVQEAMKVQLQFLEEKLEGYKYIGEGRDGGTSGEYTAIFYDTSLFELLEENTFWLSETPAKVSVGWDAALTRVCTYALFREKATGKKFFLFNTHFDHRGEVAREKSAEMIVAKIKEINSENLPVVLTGDLNLEPDSKAIQYISGFMNDSKSVATEVVFGPEGTFNGYEFENPVTRRIDYIFTSRENIQVLKYAVLSDSKDLKYPSDHLPVFVELKFL